MCLQLQWSDPPVAVAHVENVQYSSNIFTVQHIMIRVYSCRVYIGNTLCVVQRLLYYSIIQDNGIV